MSDNFRSCIVLKCGSSSLKTPGKLFIPLPNQSRKRKKWLSLASIDPRTIEGKSNVFMCEDHFDAQKDIVNYMKFKMGFTHKIYIEDGVMPSKFDCHEDSDRPSNPSTSQIEGSKRQRFDHVKYRETSSLQKGRTRQCCSHGDNNLQDRKPYRWCAVPGCNNTSVSTTNKIFVCVPQKKEMRRKWFELAGRSPDLICENTTMFFCEDHFDLPNDMVNYIRYRVMGSVKKVLMRPGCVPSKFDCQKTLNTIPFTAQNHRNKKRLATAQDSLGDDATDNESIEGNQVITPTVGPKCPMIQIPLAAYQFAPPVQSDTDSDTDIGPDLFSQESVVPSDTLVNETSVEVTIKPEIVEDVPDNISMYYEEKDAPPLEKEPKAAGEVTLFGGFQCSVCDRTITGFRYTCVQCSDFDLCGACEASRAHEQHYVLRVPSLNPYPDVQLVLAAIRRHLMMDLDPIAEPDPIPEKSIQSQIKPENGEEMWMTINNDGFSEVDTSDLFVREDTNIPNVRPVAVISVSKKKESTLPSSDDCNTLRVTSEPMRKTVVKEEYITMSEPHDIVKELNAAPVDIEIELVNNQQQSNHNEASQETEQLTHQIGITEPDQRVHNISGLRKELEHKHIDDHRENINEHRRENRPKRKCVQNITSCSSGSSLKNEETSTNERDDEATTSTSRGPRGKNAQYYRDYRARKRAELEKEALNKANDPSTTADISTLNVAGSVTTKKRKSAAEYQREYRARKKAQRLIK